MITKRSFSNGSIVYYTSNPAISRSTLQATISYANQQQLPCIVMHASTSPNYEDLQSCEQQLAFCGVHLMLLVGQPDQVIPAANAHVMPRRLFISSIDQPQVAQYFSCPMQSISDSRVDTIEQPTIDWPGVVLAVEQVFSALHMPKTRS